MPLLSPCHPQRDWTSLSSRFPIWKLGVKRPYCTSIEFCNYLDKYHEHFSFNLKTHTTVTEISNNGDEFILVDQNRNQYRAPIVVVASGIFGNPFIPPVNGTKDNPNVMHSHFYQSANDFAGQSVMVIGISGQSKRLTILCRYAKIISHSGNFRKLPERINKNGYHSLQGLSGNSKN